MATPTSEASFPESSEMATAQPDGNATNTPTHMPRRRPRSRIISVGQAQSAHLSVKLNEIKPKKKPESGKKIKKIFSQPNRKAYRIQP